MNDQNLKPFKAGEARSRDAGQKGGVASGVARRERVRDLLLAELDKHTGLGLIERKKQGQGKPDRIYVMKFCA